MTPQNFVYPEIKDTDYHFGAGEITGNILRPDGDWRPFLPPQELQRRNGVESSACFIEAQQHTLATILEEQFDLPNQNYSARYNLIYSEASSSGGDPLKGAQSFRDKGLIPEDMLPFSSDIQSWEEFRSFKGGDRAQCEKEGKAWREKWEPKYDIVVRREMDNELKYRRLKEALKYSPVCVSVAQDYENGKPKPKGVRDIHMVELVYIDSKNAPYVWDTYEPFLKKLAPNYDFEFGMRWTLEKQVTKEEIGIFIKMLQAINSRLNAWLKEKEAVKPVDSSKLSPLNEATPMEPKYHWDTPVLARHSVRLICDEEGLSVPDKNIITAVISCESGFNPKAVNKNSDARKSTDYGICQYNDYWYIGKGKPIPSVEVALNDPEFCVRTMIKQFKAGRLKDWVCYSSGMFAKHL